MTVVIIVVSVAMFAVFVTASLTVKSVVGVCSAKNAASDNNETVTSSAITKKGIAISNQDGANAFNGTRSGTCGGSSAAATSIQGHSHVTIQNNG
jgi:hypothetical protein